MTELPCETQLVSHSVEYEPMVVNPSQIKQELRSNLLEILDL